MDSKSPQDNAVYGQNDGPGHGVAGVSKGTGSSGFLGQKSGILMDLSACTARAM